MPPHPLRLQAAIIDLDGTLVDTLGDFEEALRRMLADLGLPAVSRECVAASVGKGSAHLIHCVLKDAMVRMPRLLSAIEIEALERNAWARYQAHYAQVNGRYSTAFDGAAQGLAALRALGLRLACLTNKPTAFARALLADKGLDGAFAQVFGGDAFARMKPDPLPLLKTCEALGVAPAQALMVGDSCNDAQAARAAGCPVVLVTYGYNHGQPVRAVDADGWVDALTELAPRVLNWFCPARLP